MLIAFLNSAKHWRCYTKRLGRAVGRGHGGGRPAGGAHDRGGAAAAHDAAHLHRHGGPPRGGAARRRRHRQLAHQRLGIQRPRKPNYEPYSPFFVLQFLYLKREPRASSILPAGTGAGSKSRHQRKDFGPISLVFGIAS